MKEQAAIRTFRPCKLQCEYAEAPVGINCGKPRFSWQAVHGMRGMSQSAYHIRVATSAELLQEGRADCWDSGKMVCSDSIGIEYAGEALQPETRYYWCVKLWDSCGRESAVSSIARFDTGIPEEYVWQGSWISAPDASCQAAPLLRSEFVCSEGVKAAYLHVCGLGYYECYLNGQKVGSQVLDPGFTDYQKTVLYHTFRVEELLYPGKNAIGVILGNGWLGNDDPYITRHTGRWLSPPKLLLELRIQYEDGTCQTVVSSGNGAWKAAVSPIGRNNIYNGETYDARLEKDGWSLPSYVADTTWRDAVEVAAPGGRLCRQDQEPIEVTMDLEPVEVTNPREGIYVYDLGQNIAGWARLRVSGPEGTEVKLKYAEVLYADGTVNQENLMEADSIDIYILRGGKEECYEPRFTYHGFRYVQLEGFPGIPTGDNMTGRMVRSAVAVTGNFQCGSPLLNRIQQNALWTELSNLHSIPTDCPQRSERMGWLNDVTARAEEMVYNVGVVRFLAKWMADITDTIDPVNGAIKDTAPAMFSRRQDGDPMDMAYLLIPWLLYLYYGDIRTMEAHYEGMKGWVRFLLSRSKDGIILHRDTDLGDWASPVRYLQSEENPRSAVTPDTLMSTGYLYYDLLLLSEMAGVLDRQEDSTCYRQQAERVKAAFNREFYDPDSKQYATGSQGCNALPLWMGLVPKEDRPAVAAQLAESVRREDYHLTTGNQCTKYVLPALCMEGYVEEAYRLATQVSYPSWGYMIANGATTIWERWENSAGGGMNSHNHPMYASISGWFYQYLAGIQVEKNGVGFEHVVIAPCIPGQLDAAEASVDTVRGMLHIAWSKSERRFGLRTILPFGCTADVKLPLRAVPGGITQVKEGQQIVWQKEHEKCGTERVGTGTITAEGIQKIQLRPDQLVITVGAGSYCFTCE